YYIYNIKIMNNISKIYNYNILKKYLNKIPNINKFDIYKGKIVNILDDYVIIDFGYKYEGIIPLNEFKKKKIEINDKKDIMIINFNYYGYCLLSYQKAIKYKSWIKIKEAYKEKKKIKGYIISRTKGGFIINLYKKISCFLPGSQTDINIIKDYDYYVGKTIDVQIININFKTKNVIVSHKILIEKDIKINKKKIINTLQIGQIVEGKVKNIISYGAFIDLGGIDGLLHITDISWKKNDKPTNILKLGNKYNFIILGIDKDKLRVQLGLKQLTTNPWDSLIKEIKIGSVINGIVTAITDYGAFVEIVEGIEGLLHVSEMSWDQQLKTAKDFVKINQKLKCIILNIDKDDKKIYLSIKRFEKDPWNKIINNYTIGTRYTGIISKIFNYGLKIKLDNNVFGILLNNDINIENNIEDLSSFYKIGDKIDVKILSIDSNMRKIYLGNKQIFDNNTWKEYKKIFKINSVHKGKVTKIINNGIILKNEKYNNLIFFISYKYLKKFNYKIEDIIDFVIVDYNIKYKKIIVKPYINKKITIEKSTYGDLDELNIIKKKIEEKENKN
ncbi:MAG: S1 RNA-binding domain-containing protein, partial [Candidatus Shikimatogenerans sp. JK-2022]|nr:S1 RNA-binding domain-containing protein [Candidatus Shikimatogenerans bostrichidophilus]